MNRKLHEVACEIMATLSPDFPGADMSSELDDAIRAAVVSGDFGPGGERALRQELASLKNV